MSHSLATLVHSTRILVPVLSRDWSTDTSRLTIVSREAKKKQPYATNE